MTASIRISEKAARFVIELVEEFPPSLACDLVLNPLRAELAKLGRKRLRQRPSKAARATKKKAKREKTADVRAAVMERAGGRCECGCGFHAEHFCGHGEALTLDHFFGRSRRESVATCWALGWGCHDSKTNNRPDAERWLNKFLAHLKRNAHLGPEYGDAAREASKRLAYITTRSGLPAAPGMVPGV